MKSLNREYPAVSIVILNYNGGKDILECVESVTRIDYPAFEVIIVDNDSTDDSLLKIKKGYPGIRIIENGRNLGFAEGNNVGIRESTCPYILLLNDDAVVEKSILTDLVKAIQSDQKAGIAGPAVMYYGDPDKIWSAGGKISLFGYASHPGKGQKIESHNFPRRVDYICGCAFLIKRELVNEVGMLDSNYFTYFEDADYCFRASKSGYHCLYVPSPTVWHKSDAEWITNPAQAYYYLRNGCVFAKKNLRGLRKFIFIMSQVFVMFPYYSIKLAGKDSKIFKSLAKGLKDGLGYKVG